MSNTNAPLIWENQIIAGLHDVQPIEVEVPSAILERLLERTVGQWSKLGDVDPYWSVLTDENNRGLSLSVEQEDMFYKSGDSAMHLLDIFERRNTKMLSRGVCFELGCGVGRLTRNLAQFFEQVIAVDVSPGNIEVAKRRMAADDIRNVEFRLIASMRDFASISDFDVFYSLIVLQHNSPPVQKLILDTILPKARSGCFFQTATNMIGYRFVANDYLNSPDIGMEMHAVPQAAIYASLRSAGLDLQEVVPDPWIGVYGSNTFFASRG